MIKCGRDLLSVARRKKPGAAMHEGTPVSPQPMAQTYANQRADFGTAVKSRAQINKIDIEHTHCTLVAVANTS
jgi:hypothetical protein